MWRFLRVMYVLCRASMVACLFPVPVVFLLSSKPSERTTAFDSVLDGVKRDLASTDTPEYLCLHLTRFQEGEVTKLRC